MRQHVAEKFERARVATRGDLAHVPDCGPLRVEICGYDIEAASRPVFAGDGFEQGRVDMSRDQVPQRRCLEQAGPNSPASPSDCSKFAISPLAKTLLSISS